MDVLKLELKQLLNGIFFLYPPSFVQLMTVQPLLYSSSKSYYWFSVSFLVSTFLGMWLNICFLFSLSDEGDCQGWPIWPHCPPNLSQKDRSNTGINGIPGEQREEAEIIFGEIMCKNIPQTQHL